MVSSLENAAAVIAMQQYNLDPMGYAPLRTWLREHTATLHRPAQTDFSIVLTNGASHSIEHVLRMLLNPGDGLLMEEYTFPQVSEGIAVPAGYVPLGVPMDDFGTLLRSAIATLVTFT